MTIREQVLLSELTTFKVGGLARFVVECVSEADVREAVAFAASQDLPYTMLGEGSNVLASDTGYEGVILRMCIPTIAYVDAGEDTLVTAGAGVSWDTLVEDVAMRGLWGLENLAGIPGTVGATPVQNVGAYGSDIAQVFESAEVWNVSREEHEVFDHRACAFGYRDSVFKHDRSLIILSVTYRLKKDAGPRLGYSDLARLVSEGRDLGTPLLIAGAVREVRKAKFPDLALFGTAGSFFKNPLLSKEQFERLTAMYGAIPSFPAGEYIKVPLAFILDRILGLRGFAKGHVHLFGNQPLVLVTEDGATASEVDAFAHEIEERVKKEVGVLIEREVRSLP